MAIDELPHPCQSDHGRAGHEVHTQWRVILEAGKCLSIDVLAALKVSLSLYNIRALGRSFLYANLNIQGWLLRQTEHYTRNTRKDTNSKCFQQTNTSCACTLVFLLADVGFWSEQMYMSTCEIGPRAYSSRGQQDYF